MFVHFSQIALKWQPNSLPDSLEVLGKGMLGIFAVIVVIWAFVALLNRLTKKKES